MGTNKILIFLIVIKMCFAKKVIISHDGSERTIFIVSEVTIIKKPVVSITKPSTVLPNITILEFMKQTQKHHNTKT